MNVIQTLSHAEQMEAMRLEFDGLWRGEEYKLINAGLNPKSRFWAMQSAWNIFKGANENRNRARE